MANGAVLRIEWAQIAVIAWQTDDWFECYDCVEISCSDATANNAFPSPITAQKPKNMFLHGNHIEKGAFVWRWPRPTLGMCASRWRMGEDIDIGDWWCHSPHAVVMEFDVLSQRSKWMETNRIFQRQMEFLRNRSVNLNSDFLHLIKFSLKTAFNMDHIRVN